MVLWTLNRLNDCNATNADVGRIDTPLGRDASPAPLPPRQDAIIDTVTTSADHAVEGGITKTASASVHLPHLAVVSKQNITLQPPDKLKPDIIYLERVAWRHKNPTRTYGKPTNDPVVGRVAQDPKASLDFLRRQTWHSLDHREITVMVDNEEKIRQLTGADATKITNVFFGKNWVGGCVDRIIDIVRYSFDLAAVPEQAADRADMPTDVRVLLGSIQSINKCRQRDLINSLRTYHALALFGSAWESVRKILGPEGDPAGRNEFLSACFGSGDYSAKTGPACIKATKQMLCNLAGLSVAGFERAKQHSYLPRAIVKHYGVGALLFLPVAKDPGGQLWPKRTALGEIIDIIDGSGLPDGDWLGRAAGVIQVEIVDWILEGSIVQWPEDVLAKLTEAADTISIIEAVELLRDSRLRHEPSSGSEDAAMLDPTGNVERHAGKSTDPADEEMDMEFQEDELSEDDASSEDEDEA